MEAIKKTAAENFGGSHGLASEGEHFTLESTPDQTGKVALITGGSEGIGYGCVHTLIKKNISKLFVLSPNKEIMDSAFQDLQETFGESKKDRVVWKQIDMLDWNALGKLAFEIRKETDRLDILINNAARGIMTAKHTSYGIDEHMALDHFSHVVLTSHLLPLLKSTASKDKVRIVNLASNAHQNAPKETKFESVEELNKDYGAMAQYGRTKLADILYSKYLNRHLSSQYPNIIVNATHPGFVETRQSTEHILEPYPIAGYAMAVGMAPLKKDLYEGAVSSIFAATVAEKGGQYICPPAIVEKGTDLANDQQLEENLMKLTREVVQSKTKSESSEKGCPFKDF